MAYFEITAAGFVGDGTTDDRVLWVEAEFMFQVQDACVGTGVLTIDDLDNPEVHYEDLDYRLPEDLAALRHRLLMFQEHPPKRNKP